LSSTRSALQHFGNFIPMTPNAASALDPPAHARADAGAIIPDRAPQLQQQQEQTATTGATSTPAATK